MLAELVFLSRFLGLTFGEQPVILRADSDVQRVELRRDGKTVASIARPPWQTNVDFGNDLGPYELTAIGFGANGEEVARDTQLVNLARPAAEVLILLERSGERLAAQVRWLHITGAQPTAAVVKLDGKPVSRSATTAAIPLGTVDDGEIHVVSAELEFPGGVTAKKEIVFGGGFSETIPTELTAIAVMQRGETKPALARCIEAGGKTVAPTAVEDRAAIVSIVMNGRAPSWVPNVRAGVDVPNADLFVVEPVILGNSAAEYFPSARVPRIGGLRDALRVREVPGTKRYAEAVAASGMRALRLERRRAIVYVLGERNVKDESGVDPAAVREYLQRVGIPLYVWSLTGPRPELRGSWGEVMDVSSRALLVEAASLLREDLAQQRVAWIPAAPLDAYRAKATRDCAFQPLAGTERPWWRRGRPVRALPETRPPS